MPSKKQPRSPSMQTIVDVMHTHGIVLEDIRSQNRATIEAVEATRLALEQRIDRVEQDSKGRDAVLGVAIRDLAADLRDLKSVVQDNSVDIRGLKDDLHEQTVEIRSLRSGLQEHTVEIRGLRSGLQEHTVEIRGLRSGLQEHTVEIRTLSDKVEALARIDERVTALERRRD